MGCGASKSAIDVLPADSSKKSLAAESAHIKPLNNKPVLKPIPRNDSKKIDENISNASDRPDSTSSRDSGYGDAEYKNIITEKSKPELIEKVEREFKEHQGLGKLDFNGFCFLIE